jgi:hypothetical protein
MRSYLPAFFITLTLTSACDLQQLGIPTHAQADEADPPGFNPQPDPPGFNPQPDPPGFNPQPDPPGFNPQPDPPAE